MHVHMSACILYFKIYITIFNSICLELTIVVYKVSSKVNSYFTLQLKILNINSGLHTHLKFTRIIVYFNENIAVKFSGPNYVIPDD